MVFQWRSEGGWLDTCNMSLTCLSCCTPYLLSIFLFKSSNFTRCHNAFYKYGEATDVQIKDMIQLDFESVYVLYQVPL